MVFNNQIRPSKRNKIKETKAIGKSINTASVPISVYRELAAELQDSHKKIAYLQQENKQLIQQNQQLRQEVEKVFQSVENVKKIANSFNLKLERVDSRIEIKEVKDYNISQIKDNRDFKIWFWAIAIVSIFAIVFGVTFSLARNNQ